MATGSIFKLTEKPKIGTTGVRRDPVSFSWDARHRNSPLKPWLIPLTQRTNRVDYPGGDLVTEQVLGPNFEPQTFRGRWDDRFNYLGYAIETHLEFEEMVRRGNPIEISFEELTFEGIVTNLAAEKVGSWRINYEFTFSPHRRTDGLSLTKRAVSDREVLNVTEQVERNKERFTPAEELHDDAPQSDVSTDLHTILDNSVRDISEDFSNLEELIQDRLVAGTEVSTALLRMSQQFATIRGRSVTILNRAIEAKATTDLAFQTAVGVLNFEEWHRGVSAQMRLLVVTSSDASRSIEETADPNAIALYRPQAGESLYGVSQRFYNTPHNWRKIAERNRLEEFVMTGDELLIIPEAS